MKKILILALILCAKTAFADEKIFSTEIKNHRFEPSVIEVPANQKFFLIVKNLDKTAEEFESETLQKEKIVKGEKEIKLPIKPLKPGEYPFFGEFHAKTAQGKIIAK
jgi:hypothetical protein